MCASHITIYLMPLSTAGGSSAPTLLPGHLLPPVGSLAGVPLLSIAAASPVAVTGSAMSAPLTAVSTTASLPSLASILSAPISSLSSLPTTCATQPLVVSSALTPIPGKVVEKVQKGTYVDFKEFLYDNILLVQRLQELGHTGPSLHSAVSTSRLRDVPDALTWASCFLAYMATKIDHAETRQLAAYGMIVLQLAQQHRGSGWKLYDRQFRQQHAAGAKVLWTEINPSLMVATVLGSGSSHPQSCTLCFSADHGKEDCALASLEVSKAPLPPPASPRPGPSRQPSRVAPYRSSEHCRRYNRGWCGSSNCRYEHSCSNCHKPGHPETNCPVGRSEKGKGRQSVDKPPSSANK